MILVSGFFVFLFLSLGSFGSASILLFIVAFFFSLLVASGFNWLLHLLVFGQSRGNEDEWFMAQFLGHLLGFGLVILALVLAGMAPPPSVPYVAAAGLWLSALPHLWLCYRVWRDHYEAERQLVETVRYADRFLIAAGVLAVIALAFHVATDFRVQPVAALYFLT